MTAGHDGTLWLEPIRQALSEQIGKAIPSTWEGKPFKPVDPSLLHTVIDHTLLKADTTSDQVIALCEEAVAHRFAAVCVLPVHVSLASQRLQGSSVRVCTVVGFPLGANRSSVKEREAQQAVAEGADEIDMVIPLGALLENRVRDVYEDIVAVRQATEGKCLKVILETGSLREEQIVRGCLLAMAAAADYVKTSTGFGVRGATVEEVALMRSVVGPAMGVKASGGIRTRAQALAFLRAGATRIGASASLQLIRPREGE
jgi:deoxyribose-phosphate aldolase